MHRLTPCVLFGICPLLLIIMNSRLTHLPLPFFFVVYYPTAQLWDINSSAVRWLTPVTGRLVCVELLRARVPRSCGCCTSSFLVGKYSRVWRLGYRGRGDLCSVDTATPSCKVAGPFYLPQQWVRVPSAPRLHQHLGTGLFHFMPAGGAVVHACSNSTALGLCAHQIFFFNILTYLAAPGLSWDTRDLWSSLRHARSLAVACGIEFPEEGSNPGPLLWEHRVLTIGPPGKCQEETLFVFFFICICSGFSIFFHISSCKG